MNDLMIKKAHYSVLFSYYKDLLTAKQQQIFVFYYDEDYSIGEISEELNISRNAVFDTLKKVITQLDKYEELLELSKKSQKREELYNKYYNESTKELINELKEME